jgi:hypothetical protein
VRGILVLLVLLVAAAAGAVLAWPRLVDETALRRELARIVRDAGGEGLEIKGAVRLEFAPLPRLSVDRVALGERGDAAFAADRVDIEVAPLALLLGRIEPQRLQLVRPRLRVDGSPRAWTGAMLQASRAPILAGLGRITIVDGAVRLPERPGAAPPPVIDAVDLEVTRRVEARQLELAGAGRIGDEPLRLSAEAEPLALDAPMSLRFELVAGPDDEAASLAFQGNLRPEPAGRRAEGSVRASLPEGRLPGWLPPILGLESPLPALPGPVLLQAGLAWVPQALTLTDLDLGLAGERLRGSLSLDLAAEPRLELALEAGEATLTPAIEQALQAPGAISALPATLRGRATLQIGALGWRGDEIRRLRAEATLAPGRRLGLPRLTATLPGETALSWAGREPASEETGLVGSLSLAAGDLRSLLLWLGADPAILPEGGLTSLDLSARGAIGPDRLALDAIDARFDASRLTGSLAITAGPKPLLTLALGVDRINTALYLPAWRLPDPGLWRARLAAVDLDLDLTVERIGHDALRGQGLHLRAKTGGGRLDLADLRLDDLAGSRASLDGSADLADGGDYRLSGELDLAQPRPLLRLAGIDLPPELDRLAPWHLVARLEGDASAAGITLELGGAGVAASLEGTLGGPFDPRFLDLTGQARVEDASTLLEALGWIVPPERPSLGPLAASLEVRRNDGPADLALKARIGDSDLAGEATFAGGASWRLDGRLQAGLLDTALLSAAHDTLAIPLAFPPDSFWAWPGAWPRRPLGWGWLDAAEMKLELAAERLRHRGLMLPGARASLALGRRWLALSGLALPLAGGSLEGTVTLEHAAGHAVLGADLRLSRARAEQLAAVLAPGSGLAGELDLAAELAGRGRAIADLVASLDGRGSLTLRKGRIGGVALPGEAADLEVLTLDGPLAVARGVVTSPPPGLALRFPGGEAQLSLQLDLLPWMMEASLDGWRFEAEDRPWTLRLLGAPGRLRQVPPALPQPGPAAARP